MTPPLSQSFRLPDGRTLMYAEYGAPDGKPVFYFHGLPGSRLEPVMLDGNDLIKAGIRMIACDRPGMGGSDFQPGRGFSHWPADILALADSLGLGKFGLLGVSGGGGYVSACARLIPDRLSAAVIVSGAGRMDSPEARACLPVMARLIVGAGRPVVPPGGSALESSRNPGTWAISAKIRQQMMRSMPSGERAYFEKPGRLEAFLASTVEATRPGSAAGWPGILICTRRPWDFRLEEIYFPVRLLHGEADLNVPVAVARKVAASHPRLPGHVFPRRRAYIDIDEPSG